MPTETDPTICWSGIFVHQPLRDNTKNIRLFKVDSHSPLQLSIEIFHLFPDVLQKNSRPDYSALSYEWDPKEIQQQILVNRQPFFVRTSLYNFLCHLEEWENRCWLWADAICIDQGKVLERSEQVAMMGTLFESASHVLAWTGMPTDGVPRLFDLASELGYPGEQSSDLDFYNSKRGRRAKASFMIGDLEALSGFAKREYWHRTWIVQELALAGAVLVACGSSRCSLRDTQSLPRIWRMEATAMSDGMASDWAQAITDSPPRYHRSVLLKERLIERSSRQRFSGSLESLLRSYRGTRCMDSKDRIYTLQAIASNIREHSLSPDYSKYRPDLFWDVLDVCAARNIDFLHLLKQSLGVTSSSLMENVESTEEKRRVSGNMGNLCPKGELTIQEIMTNTDVGLDFTRFEAPDGWKGVTMAQVRVYNTVWVVQEGHYSDVSNDFYHDTYSSGEILSVSTRTVSIKRGLVVERRLREPMQPKCCWALLSREPVASNETRLSQLELMHDIPLLSGHPARIDITARVVMVLLMFDSIRRGEPVFEVQKRTKTL